MATAISYDGTSLQTSSFRTSLAQHELTAFRRIKDQQVAKEDGRVFVDAIFGPKIIPVRGTIVGSSAADLDSKIIDLQKLLQKEQKNLDIAFDSSGIGTIRYVATPRNLKIERGTHMLTWCPFSVDFYVPSGVGTATSTTNISEDNITTDGHTFTATIAGSAPPKPVITATFVDSNVLNGIKITNSTTGKSITVSESGNFADGDVLEVDCSQKTVKLNYVNHDYSGVFPTFTPGDNSMKVNVYGSGEGVDEEQTSYTDDWGVYDTNYFAQSFEVDGNGEVSKVSMLLEKVVVGGVSYNGGNPVALEIQTDSGGSPSGTAVTNGTTSVTIGSIPQEKTWIDFVFSTPPTLTLNTKYWLVLKFLEGDANVYVAASYNRAASDSYSDGAAKYSEDSGSNWSSFSGEGSSYWHDAAFKVYTWSGAPTFDIDIDIDYYKTYR